MAQDRSAFNEVDEAIKPVPAPLPTPTQTEIISELQEELTNMLALFAKERVEVANLESEILADMDVDFDFETSQFLAEDSMGEVIWQGISPAFISANSFLKHVLEKNKASIQEAKIELHELLQMNHIEFSLLSEAEKHRYLLFVCVLTDAILQDLRILANKYEHEIEFCLNFEIIKEITMEAVINGATTILIDMQLYHPDHQKQFAEYRQQLYSAIAVTDLSYHEFFSIMHGHVVAAMKFVKEYQPDLKHGVEEKKPTGVLTEAIRFTALPPQVADKAPEPAPAPKTEESRRCVIL